MSSKIYIYVNGILTWPGDARNWNGRAVTWTHTMTDHKAEKIEYYVGPISRAFGQKKRAEKLARTLEFYQGWDIVLVGHSNGCDVILDTLRAHPEIRVYELHLISAACETNFGRNGLNARPQLPVTVWIAQQDRAMKWAALKPARWLGYGIMGKVGAQNVADRDRVQVVIENFGHSDWFSEAELPTTMARILGDHN